MNIEVFNKEVEVLKEDVSKHEVVDLMKGTGYLYEFIKYFNIMPWEIRDDYKFAYDRFGVLHFYMKEASGWESIYVFTRIRKEPKSRQERVRDHIRDILKYAWGYR